MKTNILRVGLDYAAPIPLHTDYSKGDFKGFEVDLMNELAKELGLVLQHSISHWKDILQDLQQGKIDAICSAGTITEERKKTFGFSKPYLDFHLCVVCNRKNILLAMELENQRIGVRVTTEAERYIKANFSNIQLKTFGTNEEAYEELTRQNINALIDDSPIAVGLTKQNPQLMISELLAHSESQYAIILRKENTELKYKIDLVIDRLERDGFLEKNRNKWFNGNKF